MLILIDPEIMSLQHEYFQLVKTIQDAEQFIELKKTWAGLKQSEYSDEFFSLLAKAEADMWRSRIKLRGINVKIEVIVNKSNKLYAQEHLPKIS